MTLEEIKEALGLKIGRCGEEWGGTWEVQVSAHCYACGFDTEQEAILQGLVEGEKSDKAKALILNALLAYTPTQAVAQEPPCGSFFKDGTSYKHRTGNIYACRVLNLQTGELGLIHQYTYEVTPVRHLTEDEVSDLVPCTADGTPIKGTE